MDKIDVNVAGLDHDAITTRYTIKLYGVVNRSVCVQYVQYVRNINSGHCGPI